jgi:hypothetical protein
MDGNFFTKGSRTMQNRIRTGVLAALFAASLLLTPINAKAQQAQEDGAFVLGSILLSILHFPMKLVTCVGTQATAAVAYTATYGVPGHYDGGTNGRDIGETARRSCTGDWIITPRQVKQDYGE